VHVLAVVSLQHEPLGYDPCQQAGIDGVVGSLVPASASGNARSCDP
jgi:hypothetical protein